ncbi:MAG TPA: response regulator [Nitrososphaera sp.]|nr:response regulator [Nitrososphaera sp.]
MVVDDESDLLAVTIKMLEKEGYQVHAFSDPEQALQHFKKEDCRTCVLIVSDIRMPAMSGFELVRQIKEIRPQTKVILASSFVIHKGEFEKVMPSLQIDDFVKKPFTKAELVEAIKKIGREQKSKNNSL